jgi:hypothetical protein
VDNSVLDALGMSRPGYMVNTPARRLGTAGAVGLLGANSAQNALRGGNQSAQPENPQTPKVASDRLTKALTGLMKKSALEAVVCHLDVVLRHMSMPKSAAVRQIQASILRQTPLVDAVKMAYPHLTLVDSKIIAAGMVMGASRLQNRF